MRKTKKAAPDVVGIGSGDGKRCEAAASISMQIVPCINTQRKGINRGRRVN